jgi:hypothetical protein
MNSAPNYGVHSTNPIAVLDQELARTPSLEMKWTGMPQIGPVMKEVVGQWEEAVRKVVYRPIL